MLSSLIPFKIAFQISSHLYDELITISQNLFSGFYNRGFSASTYDDRGRVGSRLTASYDGRFAKTPSPRRIDVLEAGVIIKTISFSEFPSLLLCSVTP